MIKTSEVTYNFPERKYKVEDAWIGNQLISISDNCLEIQTATLAFESIMGRFWFQAMLFTAIYFSSGFSHSFVLVLIPIIIIMLFIGGKAIINIKENSNIVFNRSTRMVHAHHKGKDLSTQWSPLLWDSQININNVAKIYFIFPHRNEDNTVSVDYVELSNDQRSVLHGVTTFINAFMQQGHEGLRVPKSYEWSRVFSTKVTLSPSEIWQHYAPWPFRRRYCDRVEMNTKIIFWPVWTFLLFPLLSLFALSWWLMCKVFKVSPAAVPCDAYQGDNSQRFTPQFAAKQIKPFGKYITE